MRSTDPFAGATSETGDSLRSLPADLPVPTDDGAAKHLPGTAMAMARLRATDGSVVERADLPMGRAVIFVYPRTGRPARKMPSGWDDIPGARGCTVELCSVNDTLAVLRRAGATAVLGLSTQDGAYQAEAARRLGRQNLSAAQYPHCSSRGGLWPDVG